MRVLAITTARSDYGPSFWLYQELVRELGSGFRVLIGGAHLDDAFGATASEVEAGGWPIAARVPFDSSGHDLGAAVSGFSRVLAAERPDVAVVYGDRIELLAVALAALATDVPLAHLGGGDVTEGAIDDSVRHAVTKLAHVHLPGTERAGQRILSMGEEPWRVHVVGDPALDNFVRGELATDEQIRAKVGFVPDARALLVTFHPVTRELDDVPRQARAVFAAARAHPGPVIVTAPAPDPGSAVILEQIDALCAARPDVVYVPSLGSLVYRAVLRRVGAMLGNSSSGLVEGAVVPVPAVNVGSRQMGRERTRATIDCEPEPQAISAALATALSPAFRASLTGIVSPYGDGTAAVRAARVLCTLPDRTRLLRKRFVDRT